MSKQQVRKTSFLLKAGFLKIKEYDK